MAPVEVQGIALTFRDYASAAVATDQFARDEHRVRMLKFGFFGEVGGLLAALKKVGRDRLIASQADVAAEEIGDALWYLAAVAAACNVGPDDLGAAGMRALRGHFRESARDAIPDISFRNLDGIVSQHGGGLDAVRDELISELAGRAGSLLSPLQPTLGSGKFDARPDEFGLLLASLALVAGAFGLRLEDLARRNLKKIGDRWAGPNPKYVDLFDEGMPPHEQLPRQFDIQFTERGKGPAAHVVQSIGEVFIGDPLTDNSVKPDDYRFHDVFHLAYAVHLGWSPVLRALLKRKRKSNKDIDEKQDGARAVIIEEGIATWIFNYAEPYRYFEGIDEKKLEYGLLKQVTMMVRGYEVEACPPWQWARAILSGFEVFRQIRLPENRGGIVKVNLIERSIKFEAKKKE
jgi:hypothetical protein